MSVVTRFAPSPTGDLHIGSARTALFNWLYARGRGGRYLLRIEDTDRARSTETAIAAILDGLSWLGLDADGPPIFQFARAGRHREVAMDMVERGSAFRCYVTPEALEAKRARAQAKLEEAHALTAQLKTASPAQAAELTAAAQAAQAEAAALKAELSRSPYRDGGLKPPGPNAPFVVRLRAPDAGDVLNQDLVQGDVRVKAQDIDDLVLLRADETPTYMLAVVVDDHDMGVTHVIRGDDHLTNAARQIPIFAAMGWRAPQYAHIPLIHGQDGAKLSKRHGALGVQAYRELGYLPEALLNYLARLGWSHGDDEIFSLTQAAAWFDVADVNRGAARLDLAKLGSVNAHYLRAADDDRLLALLDPMMAARTDCDWGPEVRARALAAMPLLKPRAKTLADLADQTFFLARRRPIALDGAGQTLVKEAGGARLQRLRQALSEVQPWSEAALATALRAFAAGEGVGLGKIGPVARAVLTGGAPAPDLSQTVAALGREETLARLADGLAQYAAAADGERADGASPHGGE